MKNRKSSTIKKCLAVLLSLTLVFALAACGSSDDGGDSNTNGEKLKIGIMQFGEFTALTNATNGFIDGLAEAGYVDGD